jgi:hypothetical protein
MGLEDQNRVTPQASGVGHDGGGRAMEEARDLAEPRSGQQALADGVEELGAAQPVRGLKGLPAEGAAAM